MISLDLLKEIILMYIVALILSFIITQYYYKITIKEIYNKNKIGFFMTIVYTCFSFIIISICFYSIFPAYASTYDTSIPLNDINNSNIIFNDKSTFITQNRLIVYEDDKYYGTFNYSEIIPIRNNKDYTIIIKDDIVEYTKNPSFYLSFLDNYGYSILAIGIIFAVFGIWFFIFKKSKRG